MNGLPWASPEAVGRLTVVDLMILASESPAEERKLTTFEDYAAEIGRIEAERALWDKR